MNISNSTLFGSSAIICSLTWSTVAAFPIIVKDAVPLPRPTGSTGDDIFVAKAVDANGDGIPDANPDQPDCNSNGTPDECDIALGTSNDDNANNVPDECECTAPETTASLVPISGGDDEGTENGDDDEGRFVVAFGFSNQATACPPTTCTGELVCGTTRIPVDPGEIVEIENDDEECEAEVEDGFLELEGPNIFLEVTCTNSLGSDTAQASPIGIAPDNDDETEFDD